MIIPGCLRRLISFFLSFCLIFQTFVPALVYAQEATQSAEVPTPEPTSGSVPVVHENVAEGVDYRFQDSKVSVRFTKIQTAGKLTIREVKLTPEQVVQTGALSDVAYDITSDMENGSFLYDLTLPLPQNNQNAKVKFASDQNSLDQSVVIDTNVTKSPDTIEIKGLNHFTIYFVTSGDDRATDGTWCDDSDSNCTFGEEESLKTVDGNYLDISSVTGIPGWSASYFDSQYVQFNFNHPELTGVSIANAKLKLVYKTNSIDGGYDSDAKLVISDDGNFDDPEEYEVITVKPTAATITDQPFLVQLPSQYQDSTKLTNLKIRFYLYGVADDGFVTTSFNQVLLLVNYSPPTSTFDPIDSPTNNNSPTFTGTATSNGGATVKNVEYKADTGLWISALASDGIFNFASELFKFSLSALTEGNHVFETRVIDSLDTIQTEMVSLNLTVDTTAPDITVPTNITSEATSSLGAIVTYTAPTATDTQDGSDAVSCDKNSGNTFPLGLTTVHCSSTDTAGNTANKTFNITVSDTTIPVITLNGTTPITLEIHSSYTDAGASASDNIGGNLISSIATVNPVNKDVLGLYVVTYNVSDSSGNPAAQVTRTVNVIDSIANAFAIISANLAAPGSDIANNLNLVNTNNVGSFSGLYFEKSIDGTPVGKLIFSNPLDLSDGATQEFLQNLGTSLDLANGRIALNATDSEIFASSGASLEMYDITSPVVSLNLVVRDDHDAILDPSDIISGFIYDSEVNKVIFDTAHFTQFDIDTRAPTKPTATPGAGDYSSDQSVALASSDDLSGLDKIYYTTDGSTPDKTKTEYTSTIDVNKNITIKAIAYDKAGNASDILEAIYTLTPKTSTSDGGIGGDGRSDGLAGQTPVCNNSKPGSPTLFSALGGINGVALKWTEATDPLTYYLITYGTKPGAQTYGNPNIGGKGTTGYTVSGLSGGITYYFQVRAGNGCAPGDFSNEISATVRGGAVEEGTPAEGFAPGVKGVTTDLTASPTPSATPTSAVLGETKNNRFSWELVLLFIATGGFGAWIYFRRK